MHSYQRADNYVTRLSNFNSGVFASEISGDLTTGDIVHRPNSATQNSEHGVVFAIIPFLKNATSVAKWNEPNDDPKDYCGTMTYVRWLTGELKVYPDFEMGEAMATLMFRVVARRDKQGFPTCTAQVFESMQSYFAPFHWPTPVADAMGRRNTAPQPPNYYTDIADELFRLPSLFEYQENKPRNPQWDDIAFLETLDPRYLEHIQQGVDGASDKGEPDKWDRVPILNIKHSQELEVITPPTFVNSYIQDRRYLGPEEDGTWGDTEVPLYERCWQAEPDLAYDQLGYAVAAANTRNADCNSDISSVNSEGKHVARLESRMPSHRGLEPYHYE